MIREDLEKKVDLAFLSAFYGGLLTENQRRILSLHCEEDLSLGEIAQETGVSRQGVHDMLTRASRKLTEMEACLGLAARFAHMEAELQRCRECLKDQRYEEAGSVLDALIRYDQEESNGL